MPLLQFQGTPVIKNTSVTESLDRLMWPGYRSPFKDNGPVLYDEVKPVTDYDRYFLRSMSATHSGYNRTIDSVASEAGFQEMFQPSGLHQLYIPYNNAAYNPAATTAWFYGQPPSVADWDLLRGNLAERAKTFGFDASTFVAQRKQTADYIRSAMPSFYKGVLSVCRDVSRGSRRGGRFKDWEDASNTVGQQWLAARYGLGGIIRDTSDVLKAYEVGMSRFYRVFVGEDRTSQGAVPSWQVPAALFRPTAYPSMWPAAVLGNTQGTYVESYSCRGSAGVVSLVNSPVTINLTQTALEMIPLSFVVGWFFNLPSQLIAHAPVFDRDVKYYCLGMKRTRNYVLTAEWKGKSTYYYYLNGRSGLTDRGYHQVDCRQTTTLATDVYQRRRMDPDIVPWKFAFQNNLSNAQLADLAALALGRYRKLTRLIGASK